MPKRLDETLRSTILKHLSKLRSYEPAHGRGANKLDAAKLRRAFSQDPVYSIFGLDSPRYIAAALAGGTVTSIHRKIGDAYEECARIIFSTRYGLPAEEMAYTALIPSGDRPTKRSLDVYIKLEDMPRMRRKAWTGFIRKELKQIASAPKVSVEAIGIEVRHCYQSADAKRVQADEAMARHCIVSGILPIMLVFCAQANRSVISRYRSLWIVSEAHAAYELVKTHSGFDFYRFLIANKRTFRRPVEHMLRRLEAG